MNKYKILWVFLASVLALETSAHVSVSDAERIQIAETVLGEVGFYDAMEVEKRARLAALQQGMPMVTGTILEQGSCLSYPCPIPNSYAGIQGDGSNVPDFSGIKGIKDSKGYYYRKFSPKISSLDYINSGATDALVGYQYFMTWNAAGATTNFKGRYVVVNIKPEHFKDDQPPTLQFIHVSVTDPSSYKLNIRGEYYSENSVSKNSKSTNIYHSSWSYDYDLTVVADNGKVDDLSAGPLRSCVQDSGYTDPNTLLFDIEILECDGYGLTDTDRTTIKNTMGGLRKLNLANNPGITTFGGMGALSFLSWFDLSGNNSANLNSFDQYGQIDSFVFNDSGLTVMPHVPRNSTYLDLSGNDFANGIDLLIETGNSFEDRNRDKNIQALDLSRAPDQSQQPNFETDLLNTLSGYHVKALDLSGHSLIDMNAFSAVNDLAYLTLNNTDFGDAFNSEIEVSGFKGLCALSANNTNTKGLKNKAENLPPAWPFNRTPIQFLSLKNNPNMNRVIPLQTENFKPHWMDLSGSEALKCHLFYNYVDKMNNSQIPHLTDIQSIISPLPGEDNPLPGCLIPTSQPQISMPTGCKMSKPDYLTLYDDAASGNRFATVELTTQTIIDAYPLWGVNRHEFYEFNANGDVFRTTPLVLEEPIQAIGNLPINSTIGVAACNDTACGYVRDNFTVKQGLTEPSIVDQQWLDEYQVVLEFSYPQSVFDDAAGKGRPDYFQIIPEYEQSPNAPEIPVVTVTGFQESWQTEPIYYQDFFGLNYYIKACRHDLGCTKGNWFDLQLPNDPIPAVESFNVAEDVPSNSRLLAWTVDASALPEFPGVSTVKIQMYDQNMNVIDQIITDFDINENHLLINGVLPKVYGISLCDINGCGPEITDSVFEPGLAKVSDVDSTWDISTPGQFEVTISFAYPAAAFNSNYGKPDYFSIVPLFETEADEIQVPAGSQFKARWESDPINENDFIGEDFKISACSQDFGCGAPFYMVLNTPLESADLPIPEIITSNTITSISGSDFNLTWEFPSGWTDEEILEKVDYIEITEVQPIGGHQSYFAVGFNPINYLPTKQFKFYTDDVLDVLAMKRLTRGIYYYELRACSRDRENGDVCSAPSDSGSLQWHVKRQDVSSVPLDRITNEGWYRRADGTLGVRWNFPSTGSKPDRFILENAASPATYCINYTNSQQTTWDYSASISIDYAKVEGGVFDSALYCDDIALGGNTSTLGDPTTGGGKMAIFPCANGNGCGGKQYINSIEYNRKYEVDFSTPPMSEPQSSPTLNGTIIGGPGQMKPGGWWNPDQFGTGWHFYWASELRYPEVHENYGKTYDLLGYWMAYRQTNDGIWTPTWFFSHMKQTSIGDEQFFQGDLLYVTYDGSTIDPTNVGRLQVHLDCEDNPDFNCGSNSRVQLKFNIEYDDNVFSRPQDNDVDTIFYGPDEVNIIIESFDGLIIDPSLTLDNNADHYSGAWSLTNIDGTVNDEVSWVTWIDHYVEVSTVMTYDDGGLPIWLQAETCSRNPDLDPNCDQTNYPRGDYFDNYVTKPGVNGNTFKTVKNGFNPLGATPTGPGGFDLSEQLVYLGKGGRSFSDVDGYTKGEFWLNVQEDLVEEGYTRGLSISHGFSEGTMKPMSKQASFHDIRFFINEQNEWERTCDPNNALFNSCQIRFTWFTDDYFPSIEPYYSYRSSGGSWTAKQPLDQLCPGVPMGQFVTTNFICDSITEAGEYQFFLHKDNYASGGSTVEIAKSEILTIEACQTGAPCDGTTQPLAAAVPPSPESHMESITPDPLNDLVGVTAGAFDVDESGSVNYTLPIYAPKGRGGLAPQLALAYNSNAGNGIAGQGWNISGTSSITRCLRSIEHDPGIAPQDLKPISMTWDDAFCLDGMRLYKTFEDASQVEYRTEIANFSKVIAEKNALYPNGPRKFTVYTKSGETWTYGSPGTAFKAGVIFPTATSSGAQVLANDGSGTVHTWLLAQIAETKTNTTFLNRIKFSYDTQDGESYLGLVRWSNFGSGEAPHYEVHFNYDTTARSDAMHHYGIGTEYKSLLNLASVSTFIRESNSGAASLQEVRRLKLNYEEPNTANNPTGLKRLVSAEQCLNAGTCLQPVEFTWDEGLTTTGLSTLLADSFSGDEISALQDMGYGSYKPIDINGDGIMEMIFIRGYDRGNSIEQNLDARYWIAANKDSIALNGIPNDPIWPWGGNGCVDLNDGNQYFDVVCNTGIQPFHADEYHDYNAEMWFIYDFNSDGNQDVLSTRRDGDGFENYQIFLSNGQTICQSGTQTGCSNLAPINTGIPFNFTLSGSAFLDFTGDGLPDLMTFDEISDSVYQYKIYPSTVNPLSHMAPSTIGSYSVDLDAELLAPRDMICENVPIPAQQGGGVFQRNLCVDIYAFSDYGSKTYIDKVEVSPTDLNGDGLNDLLLTYTYEYLRGGFEDTDTCELPPFQRIDANKVDLPDYQARAADSSTLEPLLGGTPGNSSQPCEQQFKAFLIAENDANGQVKFKYAGRAGTLKSSINYVTACEDGDSYSACLPNTSSKHDSSRVQDVNGDGLGDFVTLNKQGNYQYQLNLGFTETYTYQPGILPGYSFEKLQFSEVKDINTDDIPPTHLTSCNVHSRTDDDVNVCARSFLTQFIDYDLDGDLDVLMPKSVPENQPIASYYQLYLYGLQSNGEFGYSEPIDTTIQAFYTSSNRQPQDFNNAIWDVNGDSHYDYFSLLRRQQSNGDWDTKQTVKLGANSWKTRNKITQIENQLGAENLVSKITVDYEAATDPSSSVYTRTTGSMINLFNYGLGSPVFDVYAPMYLVSQVGKTAPTAAAPNGMAFMTYAYEGFKIQGGGRGSLGFSSIMTFDPYHDVLTTTQYRQDFPFIGMPELTQADQNGTLLSYSHSDYLSHAFPLSDGKQSVFPYLKRSYEKSYLLNVAGDRNLSNPLGYNINGTSEHKVTISDFTYLGTDMDHGNLTRSDVRTCVASVSQPTVSTDLNSVCGQSGQKLIERKFTENTYDDNATAWFLGRLDYSKTTTTRLRNSVNTSIDGTYASSVRESAFDYHPVTGQLTKEEVLGNASQYLKTFYTYDDYGQGTGKYLCSSQVSDAVCQTIPVNIQSRPADNTYIHRFEQSVYDPEWKEYVNQQKSPFTDFTPFAHVSDTNTVENSTGFALDTGRVINASTMRVNPDFYQPGAPVRDIYGNPYVVSNVNNIDTRSVFGVFGDVHASASITGGSSSVTKRWCSGSNINTYQCPATASTVVLEQSSGAPTSRKFYDALGREVRSQMRNFIGEWQTTDTQYDIMGRTVRQTDPYTMNGSGQVTSASSPLWSLTKYDPLDRVVFMQNPTQCVEDFVPANGLEAPLNPTCASTHIITTTSYNGLAVSNTNAVNQTTTQTFDLMGQVIASTDNLGGVVDYGYDAQGNLTETTSYLNGSPITITMHYDDLGRKLNMNDPDKGFWQYSYNAAGELIEQKSANSGSNWSVRNWYDIQGRLVYRVDADGTRSIFEYDLFNSYGLLVGEHVRGQYQSQGMAQSKRLLLDDYRRPHMILTTVYDTNDPSTPAQVTYVAKTTYDQYSRVFQQFDNIDQAHEDQPQGLQYFYNNFGYQHLIRDAENGLNGQEYYRLLAVDQRGQVVHERKHGNFDTWKGYNPQTGLLQFTETRDQFNEVSQYMTFAFDPIGNLTRRTDSVIELGFVQRPVNEYFTYDDLNRLKRVFWDAIDVSDWGPGLRSRANHNYDETGNLLYNSGSNRGLGLTMEYNHPTKPHAVTRTHRGTIDKTYQYDNNGNVTHIIGNSLNNQNTGLTTIDYSSYDMATRMEANGWIADIRYNGARSRFLRKDRRVDGSDARVTHYLGSVEYIYENNTTRTKRHLGDMIIESVDNSAIRSQWQYSHLLKDHLGSTHTVVNRQGQQIERFNFSAWGERRRPPLTGNEPHVFWPYWSGYDSIGMADAIDNTTNRGFTGHEHFDQIGIIHMNGRIYDPSMGRFLQADPIIQDPYNTQSLNRYSYVMNNPLSFTDPSGYSRLRKGWWRTPLSYAVMFIPLPGLNVYAAAFIRGALSGAVATGNLKGALKGGIQAALTYGIGHGKGGFKGEGWFKPGMSRMLAHATLGGISAEVDGGKFGHGFATSFLTDGVDKMGLADLKNPAARYVANIIVGGTISELTGGKFSNGAQSAAFRVAFNDFGEMLNKWMNSKMGDQNEVTKAQAPSDGDLAMSALGEVPKMYGRAAATIATTSLNVSSDLAVGFADGVTPDFIWDPIDMYDPNYPVIYGIGETMGNMTVMGGGYAGVASKAGPLKQWIRFGPSYSRAAGERISYSIRWGASSAHGGRYIRQIPSQRLQRLNQWLRAKKLPGDNWRVQDAGHLHIFR